MSDNLRKIKMISLAGKEVTVKELTVGEVAELLDEMKGYQPHVLDVLMEHDLPASVVMTSSGIEEEKLMSLAPSVLNPLYEAVAEVNPSLAALTERLRKVVDKQLETISGKLPAGL